MTLNKILKKPHITQKMIELPVGTKFFVVNGLWYGEIIDKNSVKYVKLIHIERNKFKIVQ